MCEESGVITRSYPSFITLQIDAPTLSSLCYSPSRYSSVIFSSLFDTFYFCHSSFSIPLYSSITLTSFFSVSLLFCFLDLSFDITQIQNPPLYSHLKASFLNKYRLSDLSLSCCTPFNNPLTPPFLSVSQGSDKSTTSTGLIHRHLRLIHRRFTFPFGRSNFSLSL